MIPAQNAPLTRSPRDDDGDDGDGADSSAWVEDKKQLGAMSSWQPERRPLNLFRPALSCWTNKGGKERVPQFRRMKKFSPPRVFSD